MVRPVASSHINNLSLEQLDYWSRNLEYCEYVRYEKDISTFGFMNAGSGYGRRGINDGTERSFRKGKRQFKVLTHFDELKYVSS
jgi:hypothetical protein